MATNSKEEMKAIIIDWDQFDELPEGEKSVIDPEIDAFEQVAPPLPGVYPFRIEFANDGAQVKYTDKGKPYYSARLELTLVSEDENLDGAKAYPTVTTLIGRGKSSSTMATLLIKGGGKLTSNTASDKQVMQDFRKWVLSEPMIQSEVDWTVGYQESDKTWVTKYPSYKSIPTDGNGDKPFRFEFTRKDGSAVTTGAILQVKTYFGKNQPIRTNNTTAEITPTKSLSDIPRKRVTINDEEDDTQEIEKLEKQVSGNGRRR